LLLVHDSFGTKGWTVLIHDDFGTYEINFGERILENYSNLAKLNARVLSPFIDTQ